VNDQAGKPQSSGRCSATHVTKIACQRNSARPPNVAPRPPPNVVPCPQPTAASPTCLGPHRCLQTQGPRICNSSWPQLLSRVHVPQANGIAPNNPRQAGCWCENTQSMQQVAAVTACCPTRITLTCRPSPQLVVSAAARGGRGTRAFRPTLAAWPGLPGTSAAAAAAP
jgi:hypothetical protein